MWVLNRSCKNQILKQCISSSQCVRSYQTSTRTWKPQRVKPWQQERIKPYSATKPFDPKLVTKYQEPQSRRWHLFDARDQIVGRLAQHLATLLMGKKKPTFSRSRNEGDTVVVLNCEKVVFTGRKWQYKLYYKHSGYPGGLKITPAYRLLKNRPQMVLWKAVYGMLPKNSMREQRMSRLKIFVGEEHPYKAQFKMQVRSTVKDEDVPDDPLEFAKKYGDEEMITLTKFWLSKGHDFGNPGI